MLRVLAGLSLVTSAVSVAQTAPPAPPPESTVSPTPSVAPAPEVQVAPPAPVVAEAPPPVVEEPKMKKVCHLEDVAGSAFPRTICKMKPVKPKDAM